MDSRFPTLDEVRAAHPGELAVLLSTLTSDAVTDLTAAESEAVVVATQRVASFSHALQAVAVDRFAELVVDEQELHAAELTATRDAQRAQAEARGETWRGSTGAFSLPEPQQVAASSLAPLLRISPRTMRTRLERARSLMELPHTLSLALAGELEPWRVDAVVVASRDVAAERLAEFEARLFAGDVVDLPKPRLADRARRAALRADPEGVEAAVSRGPRRRGLRVAPSQTLGLTRWALEVPDEQSQRLFAAVDELAQEYLAADRAATGANGADGVARERRTVEAARLDALVDLAMGNAHVETCVELLVPVGVGTPTFVRRPGRREAAATVFTPQWSDPAGTLDEVWLDLVLGNVTHDTLAAGHLERAHGLRLGSWLEVAANPFLTFIPPHSPPAARSTPPPGSDPPAPPTESTESTEPTWPTWPVTPTASPHGPPLPPDDPGGGDDRVWFVDGLVETPGATALLPAQVVALLADPDTGLRVRADRPGSTDGTPRQRRRYRPGKRLADRVRARDRHCRFPGCSVPAARCQLDHVVPHPQGETVEANLHCLCPAHHGFKHHAGWALTMTPDGTCTWTAPTGRSHTTTPPDPRDLAA